MVKKYLDKVLEVISFNMGMFLGKKEGKAFLYSSDHENWNDSWYGFSYDANFYF